jgi:hypothetical protein
MNIDCDLSNIHQRKPIIIWAIIKITREHIKAPGLISVNFRHLCSRLAHIIARIIPAVTKPMRNNTNKRLTFLSFVSGIQIPGF